MPPAKSAFERIAALAERNPRRALGLAQRALARRAGSADEPAAAHTLGWALFYAEQFDEARAQFRAALPGLAAQPNGRPALQCRLGLLATDLYQYRQPELLTELAALAHELQAAGATSEAGRAQIHQAILLNMRGDYQQAAAVLDAIEAAVMAAHSTDTVRWLRVRAIAAQEQNEHARAQSLLRRSSDLAAALRSPLERAKCQFELAWSDLQSEHLEEAQREFAQLGRAFQKLGLPARAALSMAHCATALMRRGLYHEALPTLLEALEQFQRLGRSLDIARIQIELGNLSFFTGQWAAALAYYLRGETTYLASGVEGSAITARRNRATVYRTQKRFAEADTLLRDCETRAQALGFYKELASIWQEQANLLAGTGEHAASAQKYGQAKHAFAAAQNMLGAADCAIEQGNHALAQGAPAAAEALFREAEPHLAGHPHHQWRALGGLARCAAARGDTAAAMAGYQAALAIITRLRERLATEAISSSLYQQASELHADALALAAAEGQAETALAIAENQRALVLRRLLTTERSAIASPNQARHDRLRASITTLIPAAADGDQAAGQRLDQALADYGELLLHARHQQAPTNFTQPPPVALAGTRAALAAAYGSDWTALCFAELPGTLLLYVLTPEELWQHRITVDKTFIGRVGRASRPEFRRLTYRSSTPSQPAPASWKQARALADQLLPPAVRARLHPNHRLLIVPASMLHRLPWPALRVGEAWLAEQAIIQLAPSLATWQLLGRAAPAPGSEALIVGCSEFGSRAAPLRTVPEEVADVARRWPGPSRTLLDAQATRAALLNIPPGELRRYRVLHFATHAQLLPQHGLAAHIQLWDDILLLPEVAALPLDNALVMLSTCDGAATHPLPGEEHFSLAHALLAAGASGVVASVWPVSNEAALGVVKAFYTALQQQPDPASALAHAQRVLMAGAAGDEASLPYGWGGFVFMGH